MSAIVVILQDYWPYFIAASDAQMRLLCRPWTWLGGDYKLQTLTLGLTQMPGHKPPGSEQIHICKLHYWFRCITNPIWWGAHTCKPHSAPCLTGHEREMSCHLDVEEYSITARIWIEHVFHVLKDPWTSTDDCKRVIVRKILLRSLCLLHS